MPDLYTLKLLIRRLISRGKSKYLWKDSLRYELNANTKIGMAPNNKGMSYFR